ncbi:MAG: hypothetical protein AAGD33_06050 [Actinomycetota bacterium]
MSASESTWDAKEVDDAFRGVHQFATRRLVARGASSDQAADAVQSMFEKMLRNWSEEEPRLISWQENKGWYVRAAFHEWLMQLRSEARRRNREDRYASEEDLADSTVPADQLRLLDLPGAARLSDLQREYIELLQAGELSLADIAIMRGKTVRSVQRVVERARNTLRAT